VLMFALPSMVAISYEQWCDFSMNKRYIKTQAGTMVSPSGSNWSINIRHKSALYYPECCNGECHDYLSVMLNVIMLNVIMLSVVMLSVVAPS
jgi:hypothetical protein